MNGLRRAVLFDRDGVLNRQIVGGYVLSPDDFEWLPGARAALARVSAAGWTCAVVTNQACIGRGLVSASRVRAIHDRMLRDAAAVGARIDGVFVCPHRPEDGCGCRKPRPGLLYQAARALRLDLAASVLIGDSRTDIEAAAAAGARAIRVGASRSDRADVGGAEWAPDAAAAVEALLRFERGRRQQRADWDN